MSSVTKNRVSYLSRQISALALQKNPHSNIRINVLSDVIADVLMTNKSDLSFMLMLHEKISFDFGFETIVAVFFNKNSDLADVALFQYSQRSRKKGLNFIEVIEKVPLVIKDRKSAKPLKNVGDYAKSLDANLFYLYSDASDINDVTRYCESVVKDYPPHKSVICSTVQFAEQMQDFEPGLPINIHESHSVFEPTVSDLGVFIIAHAAPYLPLEVSYYVGSTLRKAISDVFSLSNIKKYKHVQVGMEKLECQPFSVRFDEDDSIELKTFKFFSEHKLTDGQPIFDILNTAFKYDFDEVADTLNVEVQAGIQILEKQGFVYKGGVLQDEDTRINPQHYHPVKQGHRFGDDFFKVTTGVSASRFESLSGWYRRENRASGSVSLSYIDRALELQKFLMDAPKLPRLL